MAKLFPAHQNQRVYSLSFGFLRLLNRWHMDDSDGFFLRQCPHKIAVTIVDSSIKLCIVFPPGQVDGRCLIIISKINDHYKTNGE